MNDGPFPAPVSGTDKYGNWGGFGITCIWCVMESRTDILNHPNFGLPATDITARATVGRI